MQSWSGPDALAKCNQTLREATEIVEVPGAEISLGNLVFLLIFIHYIFS